MCQFLETLLTINHLDLKTHLCDERVPLFSFLAEEIEYVAGYLSVSYEWQIFSPTWPYLEISTMSSWMIIIRDR